MKLFHVRIKLSAPGYKNGYIKGIVNSTNAKKAKEKVMQHYDTLIKEDSKIKNIALEIKECNELKSDFVIINQE